MDQNSTGKMEPNMKNHRCEGGCKKKIISLRHTIAGNTTKINILF